MTAAAEAGIVMPASIAAVKAKDAIRLPGRCICDLMTHLLPLFILKYVYFLTISKYNIMDNNKEGHNVDIKI
jgi:hypothetical protein